VEDIDQLKNFMVGFTQGKASFDSVDVGHGKERADSKIKGMHNLVFYAGPIKDDWGAHTQPCCQILPQKLRKFETSPPTCLNTLPVRY
jgi:hypothetical protein